MILNIAFRQGELNKNDMTHDELYFTKHLDVHSQKKTHTRSQAENKTTTTTTRSNSGE